MTRRERLAAALGVAASLAGCCGPHGERGAGSADLPMAAPRPVVLELIDRKDQPRSRGRRLLERGVQELSGRSLGLDAWMALTGGGRIPRVVAGEGSARPERVLLQVIESRRELLRRVSGDAGDSDNGVVVVAAPVLREGRYSGLCDLLLEQEAAAPVVLAVLDLQRLDQVLARAGPWEAGVVLVGTDPVAVDRVGLRLVDSARRARGAPPLETAGAEDESLAAAAAVLGGQSRLEAIRWRKVAVLE